MGVSVFRFVDLTVLIDLEWCRVVELVELDYAVCR